VAISGDSWFKLFSLRLHFRSNLGFLQAASQFMAAKVLARSGLMLKQTNLLGGLFLSSFGDRH
jgi:hypothetical protein